MRRLYEYDFQPPKVVDLSKYLENGASPKHIEIYLSKGDKYFVMVDS